MQDARALPSLTDAVFYFVISGRRSAGRGSDVMTHGSAAAVDPGVGRIFGGSLRTDLLLFPRVRVRARLD